MGFGASPFGSSPFGAAPIEGSLYVENVAPSDGAVVGPSDPLSFDIVSARGFRRFLVFAVFSTPRPVTELVYDGSRFKEPYAASVLSQDSTRASFELRRSGGWPGRPGLHLVAFDPAGVEL